MIDRSDFDQYYNTDTNFTLGAVSNDTDSTEGTDASTSADTGEVPSSSSEAEETATGFNHAALYGGIGAAAVVLIAGGAIASRKKKS